MIGDSNKNTQHNTANDDGRNAVLNQRKKTKKIILLTLCITIVFVILYYVVAAIAGKIGVGTLTETTAKPNHYTFYDADYSEDIMADSGYISLDRSIYYKDPETGMTIDLPDGSADSVPDNYRDGVEFLRDYIYAVINGDYQSVNSMYSDAYYNAGGEEKIEFTKQKLYNILFTSVSSETVNENGESVTRYTFWVEYMIRYNNGTFRNDMDSDCTRKEMFTIADRGGVMKIDGVTVYTTAG